MEEAAAPITTKPTTETFFSKVRENILRNKQIKKDGGYIGVPVPFDKMREYVPCWERGHSIQLLGPTGSGKSRLCRYLFLYQIYKFYKETGYPVKILYFPLEDGKEKVYQNILCHWLWEEHGILISLQELNSKGGRELPEFVEEKLLEGDEYFAQFEKVVHFIKDVHEPKEIFEVCKNHAVRTGKTEKYMTVIDGEELEQLRYIANDNLHTFVILDNMSNLEPGDEFSDERHAMMGLAKKYVRERMCNFFNFTVIQVLQSDFSTERQQFTREGTSIAQKLEPSLASIGEAKTISRSAHMVFNLFDPSKYGLLQYPVAHKTDPKNTYNVEILGNRLRTMRLLKNNDGDFNFMVGMLFNGMNETFEELPAPKDERMDAVYAKFKEKKKYVPTNTKPVVLTDEDDEPF